MTVAVTTASRLSNTSFPVRYRKITDILPNRTEKMLRASISVPNSVCSRLLSRT